MTDVYSQDLPHAATCSLCERVVDESATRRVAFDNAKERYPVCSECAEWLANNEEELANG